MFDRVQSTTIHADYEKHLFPEDRALMLRDLMIFGVMSYEVVRDEAGNILQVRYSSVYFE
jgi:hypothetical protein